MYTSKGLNMKSILVTGGAGFIGSAFVKTALKNAYNITVLDKLTYAGDRTRLKSVNSQIKFYKADICNARKLEHIFQQAQPDAIVHFAAETHVDRSILDTNPFIQTNIQGTANLVNLALKHKIKRFIQISTDEVYGEIKKGSFNAQSSVKPNNPYSSSKAAADFLVQAAIRAHKLPAIIIRPCNNFGPWQYPEKFIPVAILKALRNQKIPVYGKGLNIREWVYVDDCAAAILTILKKGKTGEVYNIGTAEERKNIQTVKTILSILGKPLTLIQYVKDRPGHDLRYSSDASKVRKLGWRPKVIFEIGIEDTINWIEEHRKWMDAKADELKEYWETVYQNAA